MIRTIAFLGILLITSCSTTRNTTSDKVKDPNVEVPAIPRPPAPPLDRTDPPLPGPAPEIQLGEYQYFELENGLKVYVVQNDKLPRVAFSLRIDRDAIFDGDKTGYVSFMGQLMNRGTTTKTKAEIDEAVDFIGASFSTSSRSMFGSSLTKHSEEILKIMQDVLLNPSFPEEELEKIRKLTISDIAADRDDPAAIVGNIRSLVLYGEDHPYGEMTTEAKLNNITRKDIVDFYEKYWSPKKAYMAVVGDISVQEAKKYVTTYFGDWTGPELPEHDYSHPSLPEKTTIILVDRPQSVQSEIRVAYPVHYHTGDDDFFAVKLMNQILGVGISSRLMQNLREDKGFTYGAGSGVSTDELIGRFSAGASVRNAVTDSSVHEFLYEMRNIVEHGVTEKELTAVKAYVTGSFARTLENASTIAGFAINSAIKDLPDDFYKNYLKNLNAVTVDEVNAAAKKFIKPENAYVIVVGKAAEIEEKLTVFGQVIQYDVDGHIVDKGKLNAALAGMSAEGIIDNYMAAIGGAEKLKAVSNQSQDWEIEAYGQVISIQSVKTADGKFRTDVIMGGKAQQSVICDGSIMATYSGGQKMPVDEMSDESEMINNRLFPELYYSENKVGLKLAGIDKVDGKDAYMVTISYPSGAESQAYFDVASGYKVRESTTIETPQGSFTQMSEYRDFEAVDGIFYPYSNTIQMGPQTVQGKMVKLENNGKIDEGIFLVE